ncbi:hypothetical protein CYMTET_32914 [Cymbomonas tetramitiformis]|uniref:Uncharacterized protein n=1 Tax=Cymbomonas tetramitiformis TaxID=36881 RepID=A0AAE0FE30_9CHLO|nr:hypothetical protein CYMTET_32914 [Cymbomonas tetramitiformis]
MPAVESQQELKDPWILSETPFADHPDEATYDALVTKYQEHIEGLGEEEHLVDDSEDDPASEGYYTTALHYAALRGDKEDFQRLLLCQSEDIDARDQDFLTPMHIAAENGHLQIVNLLAGAGANVNLAAKVFPPSPLPPLSLRPPFALPPLSHLLSPYAGRRTYPSRAWAPLPAPTVPKPAPLFSATYCKPTHPPLATALPPTKDPPLATALPPTKAPQLATALPPTKAPPLATALPPTKALLAGGPSVGRWPLHAPLLAGAHQ